MARGSIVEQKTVEKGGGACTVSCLTRTRTCSLHAAGAEGGADAHERELWPGVAGSAAGDASRGERASARLPFPTHSSVAALWLLPYPA